MADEATVPRLVVVLELMTVGFGDCGGDGRHDRGKYRSKRQLLEDCSEGHFSSSSHELASAEWKTQSVHQIIVANVLRPSPSCLEASD